jgi:tRNA (cmo5U34)-methyltransferase
VSGDVAIHETMGDRWEFNEEVARVFDEMLERSIPQYQTMRAAATEIGRRYVRPGTAIVDLGCSRGGALAPFVEEFGSARANTFYGFEVSEPMRRAAADRFAGERDVFVAELDLRDRYHSIKKCSLTLAVLTLQFVPVNYRQGIVRAAYESTIEGGAFVLVEKVLGAGKIDDAMVAAYHDAKGRAGYTREEIERKRLALEGVLVPLTARWNEEMLAAAGFREIDAFWGWMNFRGWIAVK